MVLANKPNKNERIPNKVRDKVFHKIKLQAA